MKWLIHLITFAITTAFFGWCAWLAYSYQPPRSAVRSYRIVLPYRCMCVSLSPFFIFASWREGGSMMSTVFLVLAMVMIPVAAYAWTFTIVLDQEFISMRHIFRQRRLRLAEISGGWLRNWSAEYVIQGQDGKKIVFPIQLQGAEYIFKRCCPNSVDSI